MVHGSCIPHDIDKIRRRISSVALLILSSNGSGALDAAYRVQGLRMEGLPHVIL